MNLNDYIALSSERPNRAVLQGLGASEELIEYLMETPNNTNWNVVGSLSGNNDKENIDFDWDNDILFMGILESSETYYDEHSQTTYALYNYSGDLCQHFNYANLEDSVTIEFNNEETIVLNCHDGRGTTSACGNDDIQIHFLIDQGNIYFSMPKTSDNMPTITKIIYHHSYPTINFLLNGGTGEIPPINNLKYGDTFLLPELSNNIIPPEGKEFVGWARLDGQIPTREYYSYLLAGTSQSVISCTYYALWDSSNLLKLTVENTGNNDALIITSESDFQTLDDYFTYCNNYNTADEIKNNVKLILKVNLENTIYYDRYILRNFNDTFHDWQWSWYQDIFVYSDHIRYQYDDE